MTFNKLAGVSLIVAVVLGVVATLFTPGGPLMDPVDYADFVEAAGALGDNASLSQAMTFILVVSFMLYWFGLHTLQRAFAGSSLMERVCGFALNIFMLGYAFLIIELGIRHILIHVLAHGVGGTAAEEKAMATTLFAAAAGLHFAFLYVASIGSAVFGWGLASRFAGMSIFKLAPLGMALTGALSFVVLMIAEHVPDVDLHGVALFSNAVLTFGALCILIIGIGIMQGRREYVGEEAAA